MSATDPSAPTSPEPGPAHLAEDGTDGREPGQGALRSLVHWAAVILAAFVIAFAVQTFLLQAFAIPSGSMEPTLRSGDRVVVNKLASDLSDLDRGDIVVFRRPDHPSVDTTMAHLIKRVVGLPGDRLSSHDGRLYVNGGPLDEPYLTPGTTTELRPTRVPEDHLFLLGDNRGRSGDSRVFGAVPADLVVGRAFVRVWPVGDIGGL
jgi:signal peptidase I